MASRSPLMEAAHAFLRAREEVEDTEAKLRKAKETLGAAERRVLDWFGCGGVRLAVEVRAAASARQEDDMTETRPQKLKAPSVPQPTPAAPQEAPLAPRNETEYAILNVDKSRISVVLTDNIGQRGLREWELDRIHVPAGGGTAWELPTITGESEVTQLLSGIMVHHKESRAYWEEGLDTRPAEPPQCYSDDGCTGNGTPGGDCKRCPLSEFGSSTRGSREAQACRESCMIFLLRPGKLLPCVVSVPPTSLRNVRRFLRITLTSEMLSFWEVETGFALTKANSKGGIQYSMIQPRVTRILTPGERERVACYREELTPCLGGVRPVPADFAQEDAPTEEKETPNTI